MANEPISQNNDPLNQNARKLLVIGGGVPDETALYLPQLMMWGIDRATLGHRKMLYGLLNEGVVQLLSAEPANAMKFLLVSDSGDARLNPLDLDPEAVTPSEGAGSALEALYRALQSRTNLQTMDEPPEPA